MKKYKPTTPGRRGMSSVTYRGVITAKKPHKALTKGIKKRAGRNSQGRITTRHQGGGRKRLYRDVDFTYDKKNILAKVETVEYDPNRSGFIALVLYADGERRYVLAPGRTKPGDTFIVAEKGDPKRGNRMRLSNIPPGTFVFNIETRPGAGARMVRSAGSYAEVLSHDAGYATLKLPSTETRKVLGDCYASIGAVSNEEHRLVNIGKAGRSRWLNKRPTVRGSAMNPVDHPHGGGEGRQGIGLRRGPKTREGKQALGVKTRRAKKYSNKLIITRRKKRKRG